MITLDRNGLMQPKCLKYTSLKTNNRQEPNISFNMMNLLKNNILDHSIDLFNLWFVFNNFQGKLQNFEGAAQYQFCQALVT